MYWLSCSPFLLPAFFWPPIKKGIHAKKKKEGNGARFSKVEIDEECRGILIHAKKSKTTDQLASILGSPEDMEQVRANPIPRARVALEQALLLFESQNDEDSLGSVSAQLSLSYICLEDDDYPMALQYADLVLQLHEPTTTSINGGEGDSSSSPSSSGLQNKLWKRYKATARMYASEASCALGDTEKSMKYLTGDGKDDAFDRLASDLAGVGMKDAACNKKAKMRLAKSQAFVKCSASAVWGRLGNQAASKQLATSAQALEGVYSPESREGSSARRAMIFCMLREGKSGAALTLMRSTR